MIINIDEKSGFCFGVVNAIHKAEEELENGKKLYCLGDIVHNNAEVSRLQKKGLITVNYEEFKLLKDCNVLIRAHGEPPLTYDIAGRNNITLIDATCPVVLGLQKKIKNKFKAVKSFNGQIVIFGKEGHAEVNGLLGQTNGKAIIIRETRDLDKLDFSLPISLFSQTTMSIDEFALIIDEIRNRMQQVTGNVDVPLKINDTICRQVANRAPKLKVFASTHDVILFASGKESSNGKVLYEICKSVNKNSYFIIGPEDIKPEWFEKAYSTGICGATSTPRWLMEQVAQRVGEIAGK